MREFPLYCEDTFSVNRAEDTVTIRQKFQWHSIRDDWSTQPLKLAPLSPPLAQASLDKTFPARFSKPPVNLEVFTSCGPFLGVENVDSYDVTLSLLRYVNETEAADPVPTNAPANVHAALGKLQETARNTFRTSEKYDYDHTAPTNFLAAVLSAQWYAKTLPYMDAQTRSNAVASLRKFFREDMLVTNRFKRREHATGSGQEFLVLETGPADEGSLNAGLLESIWAYAHFTGDWELIRERWDLIKKLYVTPAENSWVTFGCEGIVELGNEAPPCLAMARLAYKAGDMDGYNYACSIFARELVHHFLKQKGADYFRRNQPYHSMEFMDEEVYLTSLRGDTAGWQIDGPKYPTQAVVRQFANRWLGFQDTDAARFHREFLHQEVRRELDRLQQRSDAPEKYIQLRSLLLNESPADLAKVATPDEFAGPPSGILANCFSIIRTSHPTRYERLIPGGAPTPFVTGLERDVPGQNPFLVQSILTSGAESDGQKHEPVWPLVSWWKSWRTPTGQRWNFGHVTPTRSAKAPESKRLALNWNTVALVYDPD
jgi:hypothetical protein